MELPLGYLEDRLRPKVVAAPRRRDLLAVAILVILAATLLPGWFARIGPLFASPADTQATEQPSNIAQYLVNVPGQMASFYLLLALGFALALRCGAVDLSIWAVAAGGGVLAAALMNSGLPVPLAFAAAAAAGAALGAVQGLLVARAKLPSVLVTAAAAIALTLLLHLLAGPGPIALSGDPFGGLRESMPPPPLLTGRMLVVTAAYAAVMLTLAVADAFPRRLSRPNRPRELTAALAASGALAALGGACWLMDQPSAPVPAWPVGDLRVPAAAVLAGAAVLGGRGRTMLVGLLLPVALLTATVWRQDVPLLTWGSLRLHGLVLICMTIVAHMAVDNALSWRQRGKWLATGALALLVAGMALLAATATIPDPADRRGFLLAAMTVWMIGLAMLLLSRARRHPTWSSELGRRNIS